MRFISKIPALKVCITPRRVSRDPLTQEVLEVSPSVVARFNKCLFSSEEREYVEGLLRKYAYIRENGIKPTFEVHPEDLAKAEKIMEAINPEVAQNFVRSKDIVTPSNNEQQAVNEQTQATLNTLLDIVGKLAESVSSLQAKVGVEEAEEESGEDVKPPEANSPKPRGRPSKKKPATQSVNP